VQRLILDKNRIEALNQEKAIELSFFCNKLATQSVTAFASGNVPSAWKERG